MTSTSIDEICEVLKYEPAILERIQEFGRYLDVPDFVLKPLIRGWNSTTKDIVGVLYEVLEHFVTNKGSNATVQELINRVKRFQCRSGAEALERKYKNNLNIAIAHRTGSRNHNDSLGPALSPQVLPIISPSVTNARDQPDAPSTKKVIKMKGRYPEGELFGTIVNLKHNRKGAEQDELRLNHVLKGCKFTLLPSTGYGKDDIIRDLMNLSKKIKDLENAGHPVGGVLVAIMGHGNKFDQLKTESSTFCGLRAEYLSIRRAISIFENLKAPKIFLVNMCRGERNDPVQDAADDDTISAAGNEFAEDTSGNTWEDWSKMFREKFDAEEDGDRPKMQDILVAHATYPDYVAWRSTSNGTYFIRKFCEAVETYASEEEASIEELLENVSEQFRREPIPGKVDHWQSPTIEKTAFNKHFMIKYNEDH